MSIFHQFYKPHPEQCYKYVIDHGANRYFFYAGIIFVFDHGDSHTGDLHPISSRPCRAYHKTLQPTRGASGFSKAIGFRKYLVFTTCSAICPGRLSSPFVWNSIPEIFK